MWTFGLDPSLWSVQLLFPSSENTSRWWVQLSISGPLAVSTLKLWFIITGGCWNVHCQKKKKKSKVWLNWSQWERDIQLYYTYYRLNPWIHLYWSLSTCVSCLQRPSSRTSNKEKVGRFDLTNICRLCEEFHDIYWRQKPSASSIDLLETLFPLLHVIPTFCLVLIIRQRITSMEDASREASS